MPDGRKPRSGGWNRIHLIVDDIAAEVERLRASGVRFRNEIVKGPGGQQILIDDAANLRLSKCIKYFDRRDERKQVQHGGTRDQKLLLVDTVEADRVQCYVFADAVVEDTNTTAKNCLWRTSRSSGRRTG